MVNAVYEFYLFILFLTIIYDFLAFVEGIPSPDLVDFVNSMKPISVIELGKEMDDLVIKESVNTSLVLERLRFKPKDKSKLYIPLYRMISLPVVRPHLGNDVIRLDSHFVNT